jgi:hypothetical protein
MLQNFQSCLRWFLSPADGSMGNNFFAIACVFAVGRPRVPPVKRGLFGACEVDSLAPRVGSLSRSTNQISSV